MGIKMGKITELEERGRIVIPKSIREQLKIRAGQKLLIEKRNNEIVLKLTTDMGDLIRLRGCVKKSKTKPLEVKKIWK